MKYLILFISLLLGGFALGQNSDPVNDALVAYKEGRTHDAKEHIENALMNEKLAKSSKVWNFKGHVYKRLYKESSTSENSALFRETAVTSFQKAVELSPKGKYTDDSKKALRYMSATYFNDAIKGAASIKYNLDEDPVVYFQKFKELKLWLDPEENITREELQFLKNLAQGFEKIHTAGESEGAEYMTKAVEFYEQALELDSLDYKANFNLAIIYYNEGAELIGKINYNTDFGELIQIQRDCVVYFNKALPFMEKAEAIQPNRVETLKGLMFIHRALNDFDKYLEYKVLLEQSLKK